MEDYVERVARAALERKGEPVFNGSVDHARVIVEALFKHANSKIDIFSGHLNARVYGPDRVVDEAEQFLAGPSRTLRILLENSDAVSTRHPLLARLQGAQNMKIRHLPADISAVINFHLAVADSDCYRFEADKNQVSAVAAWGDKIGGLNLQDIFDSLWNRSSDVSLQCAEAG